ncbi:YheC/YheD family protein [Alkalihalobacillus sp. 1P02AB]|uniref:YheC/YheD family endospore coat-associated protein n=1 Tax=Alkalihalobacillus sp. 1P02AB TaxID=3132260 RepID=UPI0039A729BE
MNIKWRTVAKQDTIYLSTSFCEKYNIKEKRILVHFGAWKKEFNIKKEEALEENTIELSVQKSSHLDSLTKLPFAVKVEKKNLYIGPVVAFIAFESLESIKKSKLTQYEKRFNHEKLANGLFYICALDSFEPITQTVNGYYYDPNTVEESGQWKLGRFPYPAAIFRRKKLPKPLFNHLHTYVGDTIFNTYHFNKWEFWYWLAVNEKIKHYLPYTERLTDPLAQVKRMLTEYDSVYIKPIQGSLGKKIEMVKKQNECYQFINSKKTMTQIEDEGELKRYLRKFSNQKFIIQQGVPFIYEERNVDFRAYMQKGEDKRWSCSGIIAKLSKKEQIVTNIQQSDKRMLGDEAMAMLFHLGEKEAQQLVQKVEEACTFICEQLDRCQNGHYGDLALDFIIDNKLNIWILELNKSYGYVLLQQEGFEEIYEKVMTTPFLYAKSLAGF